MPWALLLAASLAQTNDVDRQVAVILVVHPDVVSAELAARLEHLVRAELTAKGVPLSPRNRVEGQDPAQCEANRVCFALIGRALGAFAVVRVEGAVVGEEVAVLVQALESTSGTLIAETSTVIPIDEVDGQVPTRVAPVVNRVASLVPPARVARAPSLLPRQPAEASDLTGQSVRRLSAAPLWITGAGAVVLAGTSVGLFAMGASARSCLNGPTSGGVPTVCVPRQEAASVAQRADIGATAGSIAAGLAIALAATTLVEYLVLRN